MNIAQQIRKLIDAANIMSAHGCEFAASACVNAIHGIAAKHGTKAPDFERHETPGITRERIGWLRAMISEVRDGIDQHHDPLSAFEAIHNCTELADDLERMLPPEPEPACVVVASDDSNIPY